MNDKYSSAALIDLKILPGQLIVTKRNPDQLTRHYCMLLCYAVFGVVLHSSYFLFYLKIMQIKISL